MPEFISKIQYKTSERGEYYDEKARTLEETIALIKNFPWAREQYAGPGITGPSVTILDPNGNYLKAGIYYGGKYSLYYLDARGGYYEKRNVRIDFVYSNINAFFAGDVNLHEFEKQRWDPQRFLIRRQFLTNTFEYRVKTSDILLLCFNWFLYFFLLSLFALFFNLIKPWHPFALVLLSLPALSAGVIVYIFRKYRGKEHQYLKISRGVDSFLFSANNKPVSIYNKNDIEKIVKYLYRIDRNRSLFEIFEIFFKDGSSIMFSNALISDITLVSKFSDKWKLKIIEKRISFYRLLQSLC